MIGIIGAMQSEIDELRKKVINQTSETISGVEYVSGQLENAEVVVAVCGVGKVFAAICAQTMILKYNPECIINIGVGCGLTSELNIGDVVIATQVCQHDMDTTAVGDPIGLISGINKVFLPCSSSVNAGLEAAVKKLGLSYRMGNAATGDLFINSSEKREYLFKTFNAVCGEMEGASIGQVCYVNNVSFAEIRGISDNGEENSGFDFYEFLDKTTQITINILIEYCRDRK